MRLASTLILAALVAGAASAHAAPPDNPEARVGAALYAQYCKQCHGAQREGYAADAAPSLSSQTFLSTASEAFLRSAIGRGRIGTAMGGYAREFGGPLYPAEIDALINFLRGDVKQVALSRQPSSGKSAAGAPVYREHCEKCHGTAEQRSSAVHLANPMFLDDASDAYLRVAIESGRQNTPMEPWKGKLSPQQISDVVAYLRSLAHPVPAPAARFSAHDGESTIGDTPIVINPKGSQATFTPRDDRYVSVQDVRKAYDAKQRLVIVDARPASDYERIRIAGSISIPYFNLKDVEKIPNDGTWVLTYCACPHHLSGIVLDELRKRGYKNSAVLDEGIFAWQQQGGAMAGAPGQLPVAAPPQH